jgi:hypothetical protein
MSTSETQPCPSGQAGIRLIASVVFLFFSCHLFSQQRVKGFVFSKEDGKPVSYASVVSDRGAGVVTDTSGMFSFWVNRRVRLRDSVQISAVGYKKIKITVADILKNGDLRLEQISKELENVIIVSSLKGSPSRFGYYRSWNEKGTGGEIGQVMELPQKNLRLKAVHVKINQNYDTCWLKLHIRHVERTLPDEELLKEEIIVPATVKYGLMEFDLGKHNIRLSRSTIFVSFEVLRCSAPGSDIPSFFFMGSEEGENLFRDTPRSHWDSGNRYTIYIKLILE